MSKKPINMSKKEAIKWGSVHVYTAFIQLVYMEAGLTIPDEFYAEDEAPRVADNLRAQGMGIDLEG